MADFLSQSKSDEIDFDAAASAFPDISLDGADPLPSAPGISSAYSTSSFTDTDFFSDALDGPGNAHAGHEVKVTGDDELEKFQNEFPEIDVPAAAPAMTSPPTHTPIGSKLPFAPKPQYSATPVLTQQLDEEEPQVIKDWREKQANEIAEREERAKAKRQETISKAESDIDKFYEDYALKKERNIRENKDSEADFLSSLNASLSAGTTWSRIADLVELQNSQSKTISRAGPGTTDLTRYKEVLLRLKREGENAPGAAGY